MFATRAVGIALAVFVLLYVPVSLLIARIWQVLWRSLTLTSCRKSADFLFTLRILPAVIAAIVTFAFTVPSFLLLEPRNAEENVGTLPILLGAACCVLFLAGVLRTVRAQRETSRMIGQWLDGSTLLEPCATVPVFQTSKDAPGMTVAGVRDPKVLISEAAVAMLTPAELRTALKHEVAHVRFCDNLKRLLFRLAAFPGMGGLERAWSEEAELAADDAAVSSPSEALDLAAALIKVSRLAPVACGTELVSGLLHSSTALRKRVERLCSWRTSPVSRKPNWWLVMPPAVLSLAGVVVSYNSVLTQLHVLTEWLVR